MAALVGLVVGMACADRIEDGTTAVVDTAMTTIESTATAAQPSSCAQWRIDYVACYPNCTVDADPFGAFDTYVVTRRCID